MGEPVEQRTGEPLGTEHAGPFADNRLVAAELEKRWNDRLAAVRNLETELEGLTASPAVDLTPADGYLVDTKLHKSSILQLTTYKGHMVSNN